MTKTIKVRVLVRINRDGTYSASGFSSPHRGGVRHARDDALMGVSAPHAYAWIEAEVPVPETPTVKGEVVG